jgi:hypothetical protein
VRSSASSAPPGFEVEALRTQVHRLRAEELIGARREAILLLSIAAHPAVHELDEMARRIADEEYAVLREGGPGSSPSGPWCCTIARCSRSS